MKVSGNKSQADEIKKLIDNVKRTSSRTKEAKANDKLRSSEKTDKVTLSSRAKEIKLAKRLIELVPDIREEKVAEIKQKIKNGTYKIDGEKIAAKLIEEGLIDELMK